MMLEIVMDTKKKVIQALYKVLAGDVIDFQKYKEKREQTAVPTKNRKIEPNPERDSELVDKLILRLEREHVNLCDDTTCDINFAYSEGYTYWAIELFSSSGAASEKFDGLYDQLSPDFFKEAEEERKQMVEQPHTECPHCNAITWGDDAADFCGSCAQEIA